MTRNFYFMPGDQVAYVPRHADHCIGHPDVEFGFIVSVNHAEGTAFVRYWSGTERDLRTKANSECTPLECLVPHMSVTQLEVGNAVHRHVSKDAWITTIRRLYNKETLEELQ